MQPKNDARNECDIACRSSFSISDILQLARGEKTARILTAVRTPARSAQGRKSP